MDSGENAAYVRHGQGQWKRRFKVYKISLTLCSGNGPSYHYLLFHLQLSKCQLFVVSDQSWSMYLLIVVLLDRWSDTNVIRKWNKWNDDNIKSFILWWDEITEQSTSMAPAADMLDDWRSQVGIICVINQHDSQTFCPSLFNFTC